MLSYSHAFIFRDFRINYLNREMRAEDQVLAQLGKGPIGSV
jgi:hypothetical protein